jgi:hypothetical protein
VNDESEEIEMLKKALEAKLFRERTMVMLAAICAKAASLTVRMASSMAYGGIAYFREPNTPPRRPLLVLSEVLSISRIRQRIRYNMAGDSSLP